MSGKKHLRRLHFGLSTLLGVQQLGYFIPYRYAESVPTPKSYPALEHLFAAAAPRYHNLLDHAEEFLPALKDLSRAPDPQPRFAQDWFPRLDAVTAYTMTRVLRPGRVIEIGAGHSTRFFAMAAADEAAGTRVEAIDPAPRADLSGYKDVTVHRHLLHETAPAFWDDIGAGDVVSLDGSHILMPGTDVDYFLSEILPRIAGRAIIHIHDICLPDPYPDVWAWRGYNEQNAVAALIAGGALDILWSSHYVATRLKGRLAKSPLSALPLNKGAIETSLWLAPLGKYGDDIRANHSEELQRKSEP